MLTILPASQATAFSCTPLATLWETNGGIFAMQSFRDQLYLGLFGYGSDSKTGMIYRYNDIDGNITEIAGLSQPDLGTSESVCALQEYGPFLYAATEERGRLFRSLNGDDWHLVHTGTFPTACTLEVHNNKLYAATAYTVPSYEQGEILYTETGDSGDWHRAKITNEPGYLREIVSHQNHLYAFSVRNGIGYWLDSLDGKNWNIQASSNVFGQNTRVFRSNSAGDTLWLGTAKYGASGTHTQIWTLKNGVLSQKYANDSLSHITGFVQAYDSQSGQPLTIASASIGFKSNPGGASAIVSSKNGGANWQTDCRFPAEEGLWALIPHNKKLYFGTMHGGERGTSGGYGRLFRIDGVQLEKSLNDKSGSFIAPIMLLLGYFPRSRNTLATLS